MKIRVAHISMQSGDDPKLQRADAEKVFTRAIALGYAVVGGTEANSKQDSEIYSAAARRAGFKYTRGGDVWIAVKKTRVRSDWDTEFEQVIDGQLRKWPDRGVLRVSWMDSEFGHRVSVLGSHFQTQRVSATRPRDNRLLAEKVSELARKHGKGRAIVLYVGDQNENDEKVDTFKGGPLTSVWDELKHYPTTHPGSGTIDVIATYDRDGRVEALNARALSDKVFHLNTDHFLIEAEFKVWEKAADIPKKGHTVKKDFPAPSPPVIGGHPNKHSGLGNKPINRVVVHSAVIKQGHGAARSLGTMNQHSNTGSWHYSTDQDETFQCSFDSYVCWHAPPNPHSVGIEMADWPKPWPDKATPAAIASLIRSSRWALPGHRRMLKRTARLTAELLLANDLPIKFCTAQDLKENRRGVTTHAEVSKAFGQSTHWDPGIWPRRRFMRLVRRYARDIRES